MINLEALTNVFADTLRRIPELVADLNPPVPESVVAHVDRNPERMSLDTVLYSMKGGTVIVAGVESVLAEGEMAWWTHRVEFYVRPGRNQSTYQIIDDIMRGVPVPGDGQRWYLCPLAAGLDPTSVLAWERRTDSEHVDYWAARTETKETGDT